MQRLAARAPVSRPTLLSRSRLCLCLLGGLVIALGSSGCATALSTMQPAETVGKNGWHVGAGVGVELPVGQMYTALDKAATVGMKYADNPDYVPTDADKRALFDAAVGLALNAPGVNYDVMLRYGPTRSMDLGLRWTTTGLHLDAKFQLFRDARGWDGALSVGWGWHFFEGLIFEALDYLKIADFSRHDLEVPLILGRRFGQWGYLWGGPKYVLARYSLSSHFVNVDEVAQSSGFIHYVGGFVGFGVGYRWVHVFVELTIMEMIARPVILGSPTDVGGLVVVPAGGIMVRW